jgi:hypothetical protein
MTPQRATLPLVRPPTQKPVEVGGHPYLIFVWTLEQWARIPDADRPRDAFPLAGLCWAAIRPA